MKNNQRVSRMTPEKDDPWIPVGVMGEHTFCKRAGIIEYESNKDDTGEEGIPVKRKFFNILYSINAIKNKMKKSFIQIIIYLCFIAVAVSLYMLHNNILILICLVATACYFLFRNIGQFCYLSYLYIQTLIAASKEPDINKKEPQDINWWSLIHCGFQIAASNEGIKDEKWKVIGRPFRILERGNLRIPVMKKLGQAKLYRQHFSKIAAYCHLLEIAEPGVSSPYGIVLFSNGYSGKSIPNYPGSSKSFHDDLISARKTFRNIKNIKINPPNRKLCYKCHHGRPTSNNWGVTWHSTCGDRFNWIPPHERAREKDLI